MFVNDSHGRSRPADQGQNNLLVNREVKTAGTGEQQWAVKYSAGAVSRLGHCYWK
ncbi:hypothetical protein J6590_068167 [Homalodisca vitripennis]|nr:hypothetical protein J6590_068167 [Homalodisca vitripennis]